ncbi:MAG: GGDEF domain-containing protein [Anaerovibrio sp.]|uniref:sensor domain-containing diguanylate cyclase n=1 Tax=Anaerovibrio sp. TaxID=1872532 RepID=UPI0025EECA9A|nr:diguanylate cyclase [Anaerovibrio sp.]MCR5176308.1 GGDEF domain-containing protein [Anaerovibrio sp.]
MMQKKYTFHDFSELERIITELTTSDAYKNASGVLLQLYNPKLDTNDQQIVKYIQEKCSKACLVGITSANIADVEYDIKDNPLELNVTIFKATRLFAFDFDLRRETGFVAGRIVQEKLQDIPNARCMLICYSCGSVALQTFIQEFSHHRLPIFGAKAGRSTRAQNIPQVYGRTVRDDGITAIIFAGDNLRLYMDNCLGFQEIGLNMRVTETKSDTVISKIDDKPAAEIYSKYLQVKPNQYFVQNVCEFPLIFHRGDCPVARVPSACDQDGSMRFTADVVQGEIFRLSYGNSHNFFQIIESSVQGIKRFQPEAVFLFECSNRIRFLEEQPQCEADSFRVNSPELSVAIGFAELFFSSTGYGGALNSALVVVGLCEGPVAEDEIHVRNDLPEEDEVDQEDKRDYIPFVDRILHFLETTSLELDQRNQELDMIATTDRLTRIYNRWELENKINEMLNSYADEKKPMSLIFMDIDHFKQINDKFGHDVGDMVLKATVRLIKNNLQPHHVFGRWGGEEFLYALPDTDLKEGKAFAERIRVQVENNCYVKARYITMSFGVAQLTPGDDLLSWVKRADQALYQAKETGRNRVVAL